MSVFQGLRWEVPSLTPPAHYSYNAAIPSMLEPVNGHEAPVQAGWMGGQLGGLGVRTDSRTSPRALLQDDRRAPMLRRPVMPASWATVAKAIAAVSLLAALVSVFLGARGGSFRAGDVFSSLPLVGSEPGEGDHNGAGVSRWPGQASLWCFALMLPFGYEPDLLAAQLEKGVGIFGCTEYTIFSNDTYTIKAKSTSSSLGDRPAELRSLPIGGTLDVKLGGKWSTAMNTDIFVRVWAAVFLLGHYRRNDWTIKADPDTVFLPGRLQQLLTAEPPGAIYINNCKFGLHGPIEVLSKQAVLNYATKPSACDGVRDDAMDMTHAIDDEDHAFGEDQFLRLCLPLVGVRHVNEFDLLLSEKACGHWSGIIPCSEGKIAFHPFKEIDRYFDCFNAALQTPNAWDTAFSAAPAPSLAPWEGAPTVAHAADIAAGANVAVAR